MRKRFICVALLLALHCGFAHAQPQPPDPVDIEPTVQKLLADDGAASAVFGISVSVDGDTAIIGAMYDNEKGLNAGSAYIFTRSELGEWTQQAKLTALDGSAGDYFGYSVSINGGTVVIGAPWDDDKGETAGSAYVFARSESGGWIQQAKFTASDSAVDDHFGYSVSIDDDTTVIGAWGNDDKGSLSGSAYIFARSESGDWTQEAKLIASDGAANDLFGRSVAISDDSALIGAIFGRAAYVFTKSESGDWTQEVKLTASDQTSGGYFAYSVSLDHDTALIGDYGTDQSGYCSGSAYIFARSESGDWTQQAKLSASDGTIGDYFGYSVSVNGNTALIGARYDDDNGDNSGSAYIFVRGSDANWTQQSKLSAYDGAAEDQFGTAVSLSDDSILIGSFGDDDKGNSSGSAYIYSYIKTSVSITSCEDLQNINNNPAGNYYLANDIDCAGFDSGDGNGFMPLGNADNPFTGTFDGQGYTISNVFINRPEQTYYVGLFGFAGKHDGSAGVEISHVNLTGLEIIGNSHVGGLFGQLYYGTVTDVHSEGYVQGVAALGGLGGDARYSTITNVSSSGLVDGYHGGNLSRIFYGGLIGGNEKTELSCSSSDADVIGNYRVGGLVGHNSGTVSSSFATGTVQGLYRVGGLAGENVGGTISDCFSTGDVSGFSGSHELGGLVGLQYQSNAVIENSYATGSVTGGDRNMRGILGLRMNGTCSGTYWDIMTSGITSDSCGSSGLTTSEMRDQSTYLDWDFDTVWTINGDYPELLCTPASSVEYTVTSSAETGGSISPDSEHTVNQGSTASFTVLADSGYKIDKVNGCGGTLSGNIYTTAPVTADCEVTASFTPHASRKGMTWGVNRYNSDLNLTFVHCYGEQGPNRGPCNPYQGDTSCSVQLPVLCVKKDGSSRPPYEPPPAGGSMNREYYTGWVEGTADLTAPVQGNAFIALDDVNAYCEAQFGKGYRAAEFHDGRWVYGMDENNFYGDTWPKSTRSGGWGFYAPGQVSNDSRFWVDINDQNANCWSRTATITKSLSVNSSGASGVAITGNPSAYSGSTNYTKTGVPSGTTITLTAPAAGSVSTSFSSWSGCDATDAAARTCTVTMSEDKTVTANFVINEYTVTPSAGEHGGISPDSPQSVEHGDTISFTLIPDSGYGIDTVGGCNGSLNGNIYTTGAITEDCEVTASFTTAYTVIPKARRHGSISPNTPQQVSEGHTASFTVTPDVGYSIRRVRGCGGSLDGNIYTTGPITRKCRVTASFKKNPVVTAKARRHGSIAPSGPQSVSPGTILSFTVTPNVGYSIKNVRGCGGTLSGNSYTTAPITRKCRVRASFRRD